MRVEAIEATRSPVGKQRVCFSDGRSLLLYPQVLADHGLFTGMELTEEAFGALQESNAAYSARQRAVRIISAASVSKQELTHRLRQKGESEENAEAAVAWLEELKLLDDASVAGQIVRSGAARGYGAARIRQMLYEKRVPRELWEEALSGLPSQEDAIDDFLRRRFCGKTPDRAQCKKATDALLRRGHSWQDIRAALSRYAPEEELFEDENHWKGL